MLTIPVTLKFVTIAIIFSNFCGSLNSKASTMPVISYLKFLKVFIRGFKNFLTSIALLLWLLFFVKIIFVIFFIIQIFKCKIFSILKLLWFQFVFSRKRELYWIVLFRDVSNCFKELLKIFMELNPFVSVKLFFVPVIETLAVSIASCKAIDVAKLQFFFQLFQYSLLKYSKKERLLATWYGIEHIHSQNSPLHLS